MKKYIFPLMIFISCQTLAWAEIVVVVNPKNKIKTLETSQLQDIYMGRNHAFEDGSTPLPLDQANLRGDFYQKLTNRPIEQIDAYWARIMFSGQASPPRVLSDDSSVINVVKENSGAIGYISKESVNKEVKPLLILK